MSVLENVQPAAAPRTLAHALPARLVLAAIVLASTLAEMLLARLRVTPSTFPDEYLYASLARSFARTGTFKVHGLSAHFPALVVPVLTAPAYLVHDVATSYGLVKLENAFVMSLAAIPAYLIARRLRVSTGLALGLAALSVAIPHFVFVAMLMSEAYAYPLALALIAAGLAAIERPTLRAQLLVLVLSGLVTLTRLQLAAIPLCVVFAMVVAALRERRLRATLREQRLLAGVVAFALVAGVVVAVVHGFGFYKLAPTLPNAGKAFKTAGADVYVVLLMTGAAIIPSALVGLALALARPRSRGEFAFGVLTASLTVLLLVQCALWGDVGMIQERYLAYLVPLLAVAFGLRWTRTPRRALPEVGVAAGLATLAALVPLSGYGIASAYSEAPVLYCLDKLLAVFHQNAGESAGVFALGATVLAAIGAGFAKLRRAPLVVVALSLVATASVLVGAASYASGKDKFARVFDLPSDMRWVDHLDKSQPATMLIAPGGSRSQAMTTLFWNPSLSSVVMLPETNSVDELADPVVNAHADGLATAAGRTLTQPILVEGIGTTVAFRNAKPVAEFNGQTLWRPTGPVHLSVVFNGRVPDGRLWRVGRIQVWGPTARLRGWVELELAAPHGLGTAHLLLKQGTHGRDYTTPDGTQRLLRIPVCGIGPWNRVYVATPTARVNGRTLTPMASVPRYVADPNACRR